MNTKYIYIILGLLGTFFWLSCEKMENTYKEFVGDGETVYLQKADSIKTRGGDKRIELSWLIMSDPKVSRYKVFWNNNRDSVENTFVNNEGVDTLRVMLTDMREDVHSFKIFTYDDKGNSSVAANAIGRVYGDMYQASLLQRAYKSILRDEADMIINWAEADNTVAFVKFEYLDNLKNPKVKIGSRDAKSDTLKNFLPGGTFKYRTAFLPDSLALDTFYTSYNSYIETKYMIELDYSLFQDAKLSDDSNIPRNNWNFSTLWLRNRDYMRLDPAKLPGLSLPNWFTIDLGMKYSLAKFMVYPFATNKNFLFRLGMPKTFEIWGTNNPSTDWNDWTLLGSYEITKPSGLPLGQVNQVDIDVASAGIAFKFSGQDENASFRYIRFKTLTTWSGDVDTVLNYLRFFGQPKE